MGLEGLIGHRERVSECLRANIMFMKDIFWISMVMDLELQPPVNALNKNAEL